MHIQPVGAFCQQLRDCFVENRVNKTRGNFSHRHKNEPPVLDLRVRDGQCVAAQHRVVEKQDVDIDDPRAVACIAFAAEAFFDLQNDWQEGFSREAGLENQYLVQERILVLDTPGGGFIKCGLPDDGAAPAADFRAGSGQKCLPVAHVAAYQ